MKIFLISLVGLFFVACSTTYPAITEYRISVPKQKVKSPESSCKRDTLKVSQVFVTSSLMSKEMKYVVGEYKEYSYNESEWAEQPNKALSDAIVKVLEDSGLFAHVSSYKSFSSSNYTLETNVAAFTQHFSSDEKSSFVKIDMTFSLIDNSSAMVIASKHIVKEKKVMKADAQSGVTALNELLFTTLQEMTQWIAKGCK
jgi:ABC-type uncharacterized transport system auxiliary subunit